MTKIKITPYTKNRSLAEIYQFSTTVFAFARKTAEDTYLQCCQFVKCRDFLNDVVRGYIKKIPISIYSFNYEPGKDPDIDLDNTVLVIKDPNKDLEPALKKAMVILNYYETLMQTEGLSSYVMVDKNVGVVTGPKEWLCSPTLTSLYTLVPRIAELPFEITNVNDLTNTYKAYIESIGKAKHDQKYGDLRYLESIYKDLEKFLSNFREVLGVGEGPYDHLLTDDIDINSFHNYSGIVTFLGDSTSYLDKARKAAFKSEKEEKVIVKEVAKPEVVAPKDTVVEKVIPTPVLGPKNAMIVHSNVPASAYGGYLPNTLKFAFVSSDGSKRVLCHEATTCREHLVSAFRALFSEDTDVDLILHGKKYGHLVDRSKMRLLVEVPGVGMDETRMLYHKTELFFAKKVINYYEKLVGFKTSVISTVVVQSAKKSYYAWLLTGSDEWMTSPILMSLYPLIIRAAKHYAYHAKELHNKIPTKIDTPTIVGMWKDLKNNPSYTSSYNILTTKHSAVIKLLKHSKDIFKEAQEAAFYVKNKYALSVAGVNLNQYTNNIGINAFLANKHINANLKENIKKIMENNKK